MAEVEPPGERLHERVDGGSRRVGRAEVAHHGDAERPGVEPFGVGADDVPVDPARPSLVDGAETVDEGVVADVVPAVSLHVVELDRPHDRGRLEPRVAVGARRVVDEGHPKRIGVLRLGPHDRLVGLPAAPRHDAGKARRRNRPQRHLRDRASHRQRPRARDMPDRPHLEPFAAADPHRLTEPPAAHRPRLAARRVGRVLDVRAHRPPRRPSARRPDPQLEPARALPVDADELERARRGHGRKRAVAVERKLANLQRREPRRSGGGQRQGEQKDEEKSPGHRGESQRDAARLLRQPPRPFPDGMLTRPRRTMQPLLESKSTWTRAPCERSELSSRRPPPRSSLRCPPPVPRRACWSSSSTTTSIP